MRIESPCVRFAATKRRRGRGGRPDCFRCTAAAWIHRSVVADCSSSTSNSSSSSTSSSRRNVTSIVASSRRCQSRYQTATSSLSTRRRYVRPTLLSVTVRHIPQSGTGDFLKPNRTQPKIFKLNIFCSIFRPKILAQIFSRFKKVFGNLFYT